MKEFSRGDFLKLGTLAFLGILAGSCEISPEACSKYQIVKESGPKNESEMDTAITVRVGDNHLKWYTSSEVTVLDNGFEIGKDANELSTEEIYKEINEEMRVPISRVKFAFGNSELCNFEVEKRKFKLEPMPIPPIQNRNYPLIKGVLYELIRTAFISKR